MKKKLSVLSLICGVGMFFGVSSASATTLVDLELVLLVDVSGSISTTEYNLQKQGYIDAFKSAAIYNAVDNGTIGKIAVSYVEWSSGYQQDKLVDWMELSDQSSSEAFANAIAGTTRAFNDNTAPGSAINWGLTELSTNSFAGTRLVLDVSGDGAENTGADTSDARDLAFSQGVTINGLPILGELGLFAWYQDNVITSDGFISSATGFDTFSIAVGQKLEREITGEVPEPTTMLLFGTGLAGLVALSRRKKK